MTVQELIDELSYIEDKTQPVLICWHSEWEDLWQVDEYNGKVKLR